VRKCPFELWIIDGNRVGLPCPKKKIKDKLLFGTGSYTVSDAVNLEGFYTVNNGTTDMFVKNFEFIGSANDPAAAFSFSSVIGETFMV
jgi:hypothetical protein